MEPFTFEEGLDYYDKSLDPRSIFANRVCKLLFDSYLVNLDDDILYVKKIYQDFDDNIRNFYELVENEIPLFALYELKQYGAKNWGFTEKEYNDAYTRTKNACLEWYCGDEIIK